MIAETITPGQLHDIAQSGSTVDLIDVRTPVEFREAHVSFARNLPLDRLNPVAIANSRRGTDEPLYVICQSGGRGMRACEKLLAAQCVNVVNVEGGTQAWVNAALPVVRGQKAISLERQVRIAAGSLVLIGAILGYFVHSLWIMLPAVVGAGLVFAGVTDTCGMGMLLSKMPWNRVGKADTSSVDSVSCRISGC